MKLHELKPAEGSVSKAYRKGRQKRPDDSFKLHIQGVFKRSPFISFFVHFLAVDPIVRRKSEGYDKKKSEKAEGFLSFRLLRSFVDIFLLLCYTPFKSLWLHSSYALQGATPCSLGRSLPIINIPKRPYG